MSNFTLYVDTFYSYSCLTFDSLTDLSAWLREHDANRVAPSVWAIRDGFVAQSEEALENFQINLPI